MGFPTLRTFGTPRCGLQVIASRHAKDNGLPPEMVVASAICNALKQRVPDKLRRAPSAVVSAFLVLKKVYNKECKCMIGQIYETKGSFLSSEVRREIVESYLVEGVRMAELSARYGVNVNHIKQMVFRYRQSLSIFDKQKTYSVKITVRSFGAPHSCVRPLYVLYFYSAVVPKAPKGHRMPFDTFIHSIAKIVHFAKSGKVYLCNT